MHLVPGARREALKLLGLLRLVERTLAVGIFLAMVSLFFVNVVSRQFASIASDFTWVEEAVRLMGLFLVFLSLGLALERGRHVGVDTWRDRLAAATRLPVRRIIDVVGLCFSLYVVWLSWQMTKFVMGTGQTSPTLNVPIFWIYLAPTFGFALLALRYALSFFGLIDRFAEQQGPSE